MNKELPKTKEELEIWLAIQEAKREDARSRVRRVLAYVGMGVLALIFLHGAMWCGDARMAYGAIAFLGPLVGYWFGERKVRKEIEAAISKMGR